MKKAFLVCTLMLLVGNCFSQDLTQVVGAQFKARDLRTIASSLIVSGDSSRIRMAKFLQTNLIGKTGATYVTIDTTTVDIVHNMNLIIGNLPSGIPLIYLSFKNDLLPLRAAYPTLNAACVNDSLNWITQYATIQIQSGRAVTNY